MGGGLPGGPRFGNCAGGFDMPAFGGGGGAIR